MSPAEAVHQAQCGCGAVQLACSGEPVRVSVCHCLDCQRRTGSAFSAQVRFAEADVTIAGDTATLRTLWQGGEPSPGVTQARGQLYTAEGKIGHLFDPKLKSGVVALWNSNTSQPGGLEFEVMDMIYHLPFRDWMELDKGPGGPAPRPAEPTEDTASVASVRTKQPARG